MSEVRVLIVEDHSIIRETLENIVQKALPGCIVDFCESIPQGLHYLKSDPYDLVISDLGFEDGKRFDIVEGARTRLIPCIILTGYSNVTFLKKALQIGVAGYVIKTSPPEELEHAIHNIVNPHPYFCPKALEIRKKINPNHSYQVPELNAIEEQILQFTINGLDQEEIAEYLGKSYHLIRHYRREMLRKNNCNMSVLIKRYMEWKG